MKNLKMLIKAVCLVWPVAGVSACITVVPPKISMTGEKTVIERQITGDYMEIESDAWIVSSVKTLSSGNSVEAFGGGYDEELTNAINIRNFHNDKIVRYKSEGVIGEANTGFILYRAAQPYEKQKAERDILMAVIKNENDARLAIFKRSVFLKEKRQPTQDELSRFGKTFAAEQEKTAFKGDWLQDPYGNWKQK